MSCSCFCFLASALSDFGVHPIGFVVSLPIPLNGRVSSSKALALEGAATGGIALKPGGRMSCLPVVVDYAEERLGRLMPLPAGVPENLPPSL